jgi:imidazole glycerol-phosphate synthase subunit HisH
MIGIVDYGAGNLRSVGKAFARLGHESVVVDSPRSLGSVDRIVLPGVGAFGFAMGEIRGRGLFEPLREWMASGRPLFGICLGLQLLLEGSEETPGTQGFGVFRGACRRFAVGRVPQIGWNGVCPLRPDPLFDGIGSGSHFYYANSFYPLPETAADILAVSEYGVEFAAVLEQRNVKGTQFHPEKSGAGGLRLLKNWVESC